MRTLLATFLTVTLLNHMAFAGAPEKKDDATHAGDPKKISVPSGGRETAPLNKKMKQEQVDFLKAVFPTVSVDRYFRDLPSALDKMKDGDEAPVSKLIFDVLTSLDEKKMKTMVEKAEEALKVQNDRGEAEAKCKAENSKCGEKKDEKWAGFLERLVRADDIARDETPAEDKDGKFKKFDEAAAEAKKTAVARMDKIEGLKAKAATDEKVRAELRKEILNENTGAFLKSHLGGPSETVALETVRASLWDETEQYKISDAVLEGGKKLRFWSENTPEGFKKLVQSIDKQDGMGLEKLGFVRKKFDKPDGEWSQLDDKFVNQPAIQKVSTPVTPPTGGGDVAAVSSLVSAKCTSCHTASVSAAGISVNDKPAKPLSDLPGFVKDAKHPGQGGVPQDVADELAKLMAARSA